MPHLTLEYTTNVDREVDFRGLFADLHEILATTGGIRIENCKSRALARETWHIGRGETSNAFVHLEVVLLEGRSTELKQRLGREILERLKRSYTPAGDLDLQITVEIRDVPKYVYFKHPEGTLSLL